MDGFLARYLASFGRIPGWFLPDAYLMLTAYNQLVAAHRPAGHVLEIGVYHGLSAIGTASFRGDGGRFVAIDPFDEDQAPGLPGRERFLDNMRRFHGDLSFVTTIAAPSSAVRPRDLGTGFTFCHIDGDHSEQATYADIELCAAVAGPGALIAIDDYYDPAFPGVAEAAVRFNIEHPGTLAPIAIGFKKALFQRLPAPFDLNARFAEVFPQVGSGRARLWRQRVRFFDRSVAAAFDCQRSTPRRLVASSALAARIEPAAAALAAPVGEVLRVPVQVTNLSPVALARDGALFGLSYHLLNADRAPLQFDHERAWLGEPLEPGASRTFDVPVRIPEEPGRYHLEFDIVWEGTLWMKEIHNPTALVALEATARDGAAGHAPVPA